MMYYGTVKASQAIPLFCKKLAVGTLLSSAAMMISVPQGRAQEEVSPGAEVTTPASLVGFNEDRFGGTSDEWKSKIEEYSHIKGWHIPTGSAYMTVLKDNDSLRTSLARHGIGLVASSSVQYTKNVMGSSQYSGEQEYWGQIDSYSSSTQVFLTYDLDRHGLEGGQLVVGGTLSLATWDNFNPGQLSFSTVSFYKPFLDGQLEVKAGYMGNTFEWIGTAIGGNAANPLGQNASIPAVLGLAPLPSGQPSFKVKWNISDNLYAQVGAMRSLPIGGPTGNIILDEINYNPSGLRFSVPNGKMLTMGEVGYLQNAGADSSFFWLRGGFMHNRSEFARLDGGPASSDAKAAYLLVDKQLFQFEPGSADTAYKGFYIGGTYMRAPEENIALYEQLELRAYVQAPFKSRPLDQLSIVYSDSKVSSHLQKAVNSTSSLTGVKAVSGQKTYNLIYTAYLADGVWGTVGATYVDNPTIVHSGKKDEALNLSASLYVRF